MIAHYSRSVKMLTSQGFRVWKTEQPWNPYTKVRRDLFNLCDGVGIDGTGPILGFQVTDGARVHAHLVKALTCEYLPLWLRSGGRFVIHGWRTIKQVKKDGKRGKADKWECRVVELLWDGSQVVVKA